MQRRNRPDEEIEDEDPAERTAPGVRGSGTRLARARLFEDGARGGRDPPARPVVGPNPTLEEIHAAYEGYVFARFVRLGVVRHAVPDLTQELFLVLHEQFLADNPPRDVHAVVNTILLHLFWNYLRERRRCWKRDGGCETDVFPTQRLDPEQSAYGVELTKILQQTLDRMPPREVRSLELLDLAELDSDVVAAIMGCDLAALHVLHCRARKTFYEIAATLAGEELAHKRPR